MAEIQQLSGYKSRPVRSAPRLDMTPMVDLAFLLLTFFVLTATFTNTKPKSMELVFPVQGESSFVKKGITFLLSKDDRIFYYEGELKPEGSKTYKTSLRELSFSSQTKNSLRGFLLEKNKDLQKQLRILAEQRKSGQIDDKTFQQLAQSQKADGESYTYLIKTDKKATYKNVIDVIDELNINMVGKYSVVDMMGPETALVEQAISEEY